MSRTQVYLAKIRAWWSRLGPIRKRWVVVALASVLVLVAVLGILSTGWTISFLSGSVSSSSLAVDSQGGVHVAFWSRGLQYASKGLLGWSQVTVDLPGSTFEVDSTSIATDASGHVYIVYPVVEPVNGGFSIYDSVLRYATDASGAWTTSQLPYHGLAPSVAVDSDGHPHIAFVELEGADAPWNLTLLTEADGGWPRTVLSAVSIVHPYTQVAVDGANHLHVAFGGSFSLAYATDASGAWRVTWFNSSNQWYSGQAMAVDRSGHAHLTYETEDSSTGVTSILYTTDAGGTWAKTELDHLQLAVNTAVATDAQGHAHVAYYDQANGTLQYATDAGGNWRSQVVGQAVGGQVPLSVGVAPNGRVHIAFFSFTGLGYATDGVDSSNAGAFLMANLLGWVPEALVGAYALYRLWLASRAPTRVAE